MNKRYKETQKSLKNSPILFDDEEMGISSLDEVNVIKSSVTPRSKSYIDHSTPIQDKCKIDCYDSPDMNYNESPMEPLTQHPPNEVGWDYQRIIIKEGDMKTPISMEISKTPKRNVLLSKKRNSNSPLLYKPLKKKLIQEEQQEHIAGFMAELKAIEIKAKKIVEKNVEVPPKSVIQNELESQLVVEMDSQSLNYSDIQLQVSAFTNESSPNNQINIKQNYNALLDDSIEDIMVLCSQEVEAKEFENQKMQCTTSANTSQEKNSLKMSPDLILDKVFNNGSKDILQTVNNYEKATDNTFNKNSSTSKRESNSLEIPDDSFDEFFVGIDDNDIGKNENIEICIDSVNKTVTNNNKPKIISKSASANSTTSKNSIVQNKFFQSKNSTYTATQLKSSSTPNCNYVNSQASNASVQNKVINTKANFGYLNKNYTRNNNNLGFDSQTEISDNNSIKNSDTRLFKAKSYSDSNFLHKSSSINNIGNSCKSNSNFNVHSTSQQKQQSNNSVNKNVKSSYYVSGYNVQNKSWRRIQSSPSIDKSSVRQQSNVNKLSNSEGPQLLSTAAEIERKRQEAIMKREAKLKSKSFDHMSLKRPIQHPIKDRGLKY